jgi:hypothetical protein
VSVPPQLGCLTRDALTAATSVTGGGRLCNKSGPSVTKTAASVTNTAVCVTNTAVSQLIHFQIHAAAARLSNSPSPNPTPAESTTIPHGGGGRGPPASTFVRAASRPGARSPVPCALCPGKEGELSSSITFSKPYFSATCHTPHPGGRGPSHLTKVISHQLPAPGSQLPAPSCLFEVL